MQDVVRQAYGITADVFYSAFVDPPEKWNLNLPRENRVITVGRFRADKCLLEFVDYCADLHRQHPDLTFMIVGKKVDPDYHSQVERKARDLGLKMELKTECGKEELANLLETSRYYLHPKPIEHFGISVLEAVCAGCLPFVHKSGGVIEIVPFEELQFENNADFLAKFAALHESESHREIRRTKLTEHSLKFGVAQFRQKFRADVEAFVGAGK
jgi:glycosyltransferase involved in cell wall biosynthesis